MLDGRGVEGKRGGWRGRGEVPRRTRWLKQNWGVKMGLVDGLDMLWGLGAEEACAALGEAQKRPATLRYGGDESDLWDVSRRELRPGRAEQELVQKNQILEPRGNDARFQDVETCTSRIL